MVWKSTQQQPGKCFLEAVTQDVLEQYRPSLLLFSQFFDSVSTESNRIKCPDEVALKLQINCVKHAVNAHFDVVKQLPVVLF